MRISDGSSDVCSSDLTAPRLGRSDRWISLSRVLLPAPEWPVTNSISPAPTSKLTSDSATWPPGYCLLTLSKRRTLMGPGFGFGVGIRKAKASSPDPPSRPDSHSLAGRSRIARAGIGESERLGVRIPDPCVSVLRVRRPRHQLLQAAADARDQRDRKSTRL